MRFLKSIFERFANNTDENSVNDRRKWLLKAAAGTTAVLGLSQTASAHKVEKDPDAEERFPGDPPEHFLAFPCNHADHEYHDHLIGSVGAMLAKYEDNVDLVVVCFAQGIHVLANKPLRPVKPEIQDRIKNLAKQGVKFPACGRTMQGLDWTQDDLFPFAEVVAVGAADIMELQERNYALMVW